MAEAQAGTEDLFRRMYADPEAVARYADGVRRFVPGLDALHRMTGVLLAETAPADARVLVLGAGGGMELRSLAEAQPGWRLVGVDPAPEMLRLAERTLGPFANRVELVEGLIDDTPAGPFDAAACLLTLHFLDRAERTRTAAAVRSRLRSGAPFVAAHGSLPHREPARSVQLARYAAYAVASGVAPEQAEAARAAVAASVSMLDPAEDAAVLRDAGFADVAEFYAALTWRGWIAHA